MPGRRSRVWIPAAAAALLFTGWLLTRASPAPEPNPAGGFSIAALGDAPYYLWEDGKYRRVLHELDAHDLSLVLHVGDIFWRPCSDQRYRRTLDELNALRHPVIYTPGDNEWTDCWERQAGAFSPLERLERIRRIFFSDPARSLGGRRLDVISQAGSAGFAEFVEHVRWTHQRVIFATVHLVGSVNGLEEFPARTAADGEAARRRTAAAAAWVRETFAAARAASAPAIVLAFHANPAFERPPGHFYREAFEPWITALEEEAATFAGSVLVIHGDNHTYIVDRPLRSRTTGDLLERLTRLQVPGSPDVGWVRVVITPGAAMPFSFELHVVPAWKYW